MTITFYWHDYETFGADPKRDRPAQFAGVRTDEGLNEICEPLVIFCKPAVDVLPHPAACLLTGITPQIADAQGLIEPEFVGRIHTELAEPGTCGVGYNSVRFDDEVTRFTLYRNFFDPYAREWQQGNSRWDIIDLARMTYALRPTGINWPHYEDGHPSFRLEDLVAANGICHESAHDALSDVRATIDLARLLKTRQPRLYNWLFQLRNKRKAIGMLDIAAHTPVVHTSRMYPAKTGCTTLVMPLIIEPGNNNSVLVYDLRYDPEIFIDLDVTELNICLFTREEDMPEGMKRLPIKSVKVNKCPAIAPRNTLNEKAADHIDIDLSACFRHWQQLCKYPDFIQRVALAYTSKGFEPIHDVDLALYDGFLNENDYSLLNSVRNASPQELTNTHFDFHDKRLPELLFRYRARNWPETLTTEESQLWRHIRQQRLEGKKGQSSISIKEFSDLITALRIKHNNDAKVLQILDALIAWRDKLLDT